MFKVLIPAVAALGLVAFTAQTQEASAPAQPGMAWHLVQEGEMAKLAYGMADNLLTAASMDGFKYLFGNVNPVLSGLRNAGLLGVDRLGAVKRAIVRQAMGVEAGA